MFNINPALSFEIPVNLTVPGQLDLGVINVVFAYQSKTDVNAWLNSAKDGKSDLDSLSEVILDWDGVNDQGGVSVPYSKESLGVLIDRFHAAAGELFSAYLKGLKESRVKN